MSLLKEVMQANEDFVQHFAQDYEDVGSKISKLPNRNLAIVTCMDTRLVDFLEPALGIGRGEAIIIKNAGNTVTGTFAATIRSLVVSVFELGVDEIMIVGHYDCGISRTTSQELIEKMLRRGISQAAIRMIQHELEEWVDEFHHPIENIEHVVAKIQCNPLVPDDVPVHGLIFDPKTGLVEVVVDGYEFSSK